ALDRSRYTPDPSATRVSIEAGITSGWTGLVDLAIGIDGFGSSGSGSEVMAHHGFTVDAVLARIREHLDGKRGS
ncbi:MAG: transketolase-like TK C-terminal-containing protein, partial [Pseudonocardiaceae bacterium]